MTVKEHHLKLMETIQRQQQEIARLEFENRQLKAKEEIYNSFMK